MNEKKAIHKFIFPSLTARFFIRVSVVVLLASLFFSQLLIPVHIRGASMEPTYRDGGFNFTWRLHYLFNEPKRHDRVIVRFAGGRVTLLKRVVAVAGEKVEFKNGRLHVNGKEIDEPYVRYPCDWNLPPRVVQEGNVYVVGDNRNMPLTDHTFGQTSIKRIIGAPLW